MSFKLADFDLNEIDTALHGLKGKFANVTTATLLFGIPPSTGNVATCSPVIARVSSIDTLHNDVSRPQILLSGAIHGDERVVNS